MPNLFTCNFEFYGFTEIHTFAYVRYFLPFIMIMTYSWGKTKNKRKFMTINSIEIIKSLIVWSLYLVIIITCRMLKTITVSHFDRFFLSIARCSNWANSSHWDFRSRTWRKSNTFIMMFTHLQLLMSANWNQSELFDVVVQYLSFGERCFNFVKATDFI